MIAAILTIVGIALAWISSRNINVWENGLLEGLVTYALAFVIAGTPLRWRLYDKWEGINYSRILATLFSLRAAADIIILLYTTRNIAHIAVAIIICASFAYLRVGSMDEVERLRDEENRREQRHELYEY